ncbi:hypothetical protein [Streptomyces sp. B6B3]|uniref:Acg family FMN-binding oxidoreductase n=1 Tax=Streptomyces sp. B6B3 TaxID=3153570 RepID=UPI00325E782F
MSSVTLDAEALETLISAAASAPSIHNSQPWRFRLDPDTTTLEVRAAPERGLRRTDPVGQALYLSVGAALFNLRVAATHLGWTPVVRPLPRPADPRSLASVRLVPRPRRGHRHADPDDGLYEATRHGLYDAVWRRHSSRFPFEEIPLPDVVRDELTAAAEAEGAALFWPDRSETARLLRLTWEAEHRNAADPGRVRDDRLWLRETTTDGLPAAALGVRDATGTVPMRDFTHRHGQGRRTVLDFERAPTIAVLTTAHDRRADWLRAGQALERLLLTATTHAVRTSLLHQAVEWPDLRWALARTGRQSGHAHMLVRLGYGPEGAPTPRRRAEDVVSQTRGR